MQQEQTPCDVVGRILLHLEPILQKIQPDIVLVQGDTSTSIAAGLASFYCKTSVGHIEAGLRTGNRHMPFPEEENRILIDALSDLWFVPTDEARMNLMKEGYDKNVMIVGNTSLDTLIDLLNDPRQIDTQIVEGLCGGAQKVILVTAHRSENIGQPLVDICNAVKKIARSNPNEVRVVFSLHPNPRVREIVLGILSDVPNIVLVEPLPYNQFIPLLERSYCVLTDSGGVQEEAAFLGKPVLILREVTERPESVRSRIARLVGTDTMRIVNMVESLLTTQQNYGQVSNLMDLSNRMSASKLIVDAILDYSSSNNT